jgi:hypothetical protein
MRNHFLFLIFVFCTLSMQDAFAQKGAIKYTYAYDYDRTGVMVSLFNESKTLVGSKTLSESDSLGNDDYIFDSLVPGKYNLVVNISEDLKLSYEVKVKPGELTNFYEWSEINYSNYLPADDSSDYMDISPYFLYGGPATGDDQNKSLQGDLSLGINYNPYFMASKHFGLGCLFGFGANYGYFKKDTIPGKKFERYAAVDLNMGLFFRFRSGNGFKNPDKGFVLDAGAYYALPLMFRHAYDIGTHRAQDLWIHQYKDFEAFARIGIRPVTIQAEYRLSDYILGNYPELPRLRIGIAFLFNAY